MVLSQPNQPDKPPTPPASGPGVWVTSTFDELRRVVWPSRQQLISESVAVLLMVTISAAAIASLDRFFHWLSQLLFR